MLVLGYLHVVCNSLLNLFYYIHIYCIFQEEVQPKQQPNAQLPQPNKDQGSATTTKRFVHAQSSDDVDTLAAERQARDTQTQTRWAVKIFHGE